MDPVDHTLRAGADACHWGYLEARRAPVLTVEPGEVVAIETVSGGPEMIPEGDFVVPPALADIHARCERMLPGHILTGPVAVAGAEPGDLLEVKILDIRLSTDWGYCFFRPLGGTLPDRFPEGRSVTIAIDRDAGLVLPPWGTKIPVSPFFGVMGVAPPPAWGRCTSIIPRAFGGNLDNKELLPGTSLFLPVFVAGAHFSCGDGHAVQGDGEVCGTAVETALDGVFSFAVHKGAATARPFALTPTHLITMATDPDLDRCAERALSDMIDQVADRTDLTPADAYQLASLAADLRITQTVNQHKGAHCVLSRSLIGI
ncbi:acetamidase/formamidase family protein [Acuticoccus mangrovi]|uniref:Acetamidase/formamidase family protein n=1 Tax=Acuticoccus mangrovi TaxID=2796142 RepID=A0A934IP73_9HYPH|nr:acetamidase/formamidase family protein [Acuticoccus mangrovi]MBJ3776018.1 acetamidase/formamidase family protein [Acuticoccus mangrovi]